MRSGCNYINAGIIKSKRRVMSYYYFFVNKLAKSYRYNSIINISSIIAYEIATQTPD